MANSSSKANGETGANKVQLMLSAEELLSLPVDALFSRLEATSSGLSSEEVAARLEVYGPNELAKGKKHYAILEFLMNFKSPLVIILMVAGLISGVFGEWANTIIIYSIVFLSVILDFYQESKAEKAAETLKEK